MTTEMDTFGLPQGRYDATLEAVEVERGGKGSWHLDLVARVHKNNKRAIESRKMGKADAYELSDSQRKSLRNLAKRIGAQDFGPPEEIVASIKAMTGETLRAYVRPNPLGGIATTLYATNGKSEVVSGEVLDRLPKVEPEYRPETQDAQGAHEQFLTGLNHMNRGAALAAEAAHKLRLNEGWKLLGYDSLSQYLADPDIAMGRTQFYSLADIWEQYIEQGGIDPIRLCAPSKLEVPLPALKAGDVTVEEAVEDAETLGLRDLRVKYRGEPEPSGRPERPTSYPFACAHCGSLIESSTDIREAHPE